MVGAQVFRIKTAEGREKGALLDPYLSPRDALAGKSPRKKVALKGGGAARVERVVARPEEAADSRSALIGESRAALMQIADKFLGHPSQDNLSEPKALKLTSKMANLLLPAPSADQARAP